MSTDDSTGPPKGLDWRAFTPDDSPRTPEDLFQDPQMQDLATPKVSVGEGAVDFDLPLYDFRDGHERETGETLHLLGRAESRPVALVFGSYT